MMVSSKESDSEGCEIQVINCTPNRAGLIGRVLTDKCDRVKQFMHIVRCNAPLLRNSPFERPPTLESPARRPDHFVVFEHAGVREEVQQVICADKSTVCPGFRLDNDFSIAISRMLPYERGAFPIGD